ncbi:ABC transporter substrate-binding protein [Roseinatronobacter alkalisoli]|uniref:ABC transporter substrate-binding protein n=1 Tax=Roseinatronobacter alkalisoli TaxID=3028235 RepID=A0ABT5T7V7_9RHOB|nr:ABC transporter substrate-binding protein [Roseinatronobacter sp. HJB301]MDD7971061.1 ABC transporter substrate-binding protein [Roseinatronobacter sp. HJB301]
MTILAILKRGACALTLAATPALAELPVLTIASQAGGTVAWELDTIRHHGFDQAHGFRLEIQDVAGKAAGQIAFQGGEVDVIVDDWIWVARQRAAGQDIAFIPYSRAVGGVMVSENSTARGLQDLAGEKIGIAGGPNDKSWIILRAYAAQQGFDLMAETEQVYGAPPLIFQTARSGELGGAINFWHFMAKQEAAGMRHLISVADAADALGMDPAMPLLGYVVQAALVSAQPGLVAAFAAASRDAKTHLGGATADWDRLRPMMNAADDAEFGTLVAGWRAGIPVAGPVDEESARAMFRLMVELGGEELVGTATDLPEGVFVPLGS